MKKTPDIIFEPEKPLTKHNKSYSNVNTGSQGRFRFDNEREEDTTVRSFRDIVYNDHGLAAASKVGIKFPPMEYKLGDTVVVFDRYTAKHIIGDVKGTHPRKGQYMVVSDTDKFKQWCSSDKTSNAHYVIQKLHSQTFTD